MAGAIKRPLLCPEQGSKKKRGEEHKRKKQSRKKGRNQEKMKR